MASDTPHPPPPADLHKHLPVMAVWAFFNIGAAVANALLLLVSLRLARLRGNLTLLNLEFIFVITCATGAMLFWTGYAMDESPPGNLCVFNAAIVLSNPLAMSGAALSLVVRVWTNAMGVYYPTLKILDVIGSSPILLAFPHVSAIAFFIVALVKSLRNRHLVNRSSPFYCTLDDPLGTTSSLIVAVFTFIALFCAGWTAAYVARSHWRVRSIRSGNNTNYPLIVRTLFFSCIVAVAFVCGIVSLLTSFSAIAQDVVGSTLGPAAFFIFATDRDVVRMLFPCCLRPRAIPSSRALSGFSSKRSAERSAEGSSDGAGTGTGSHLPAGGAELVTLGGSTVAGHSTPALGGGEDKHAHVLEVDLGADGGVLEGKPPEWIEDSDDEGDRVVHKGAAV